MRVKASSYKVIRFLSGFYKASTGFGGFTVFRHLPIFVRRVVRVLRVAFRVWGSGVWGLGFTVFSCFVWRSLKRTT